VSAIVESRRDGVVLWTLANPPVNAISMALLEDLERLVAQAEADHTVRAAVIAGRGPTFAAGADIQGFLKLGGSLPDFLNKGAALFSRLQSSRIPVVAAVNGPALGGGNELALAADIRIASTKARFGQPEVNLGIIPGWGGTHRLAQMVGFSHARKLLLTGDPISAAEAYRMGLVDQVVEPALLIETALNMAERLASLPPLALAEIKGLLSIQADQAAQDRETAAMGRLMVTQDAMEGIRAFMAHRRPRFIGE
jgi:enoyl-CoA hydratase/carnithine racemase